MSFILLANICAISPLDLELFFNVLRVSALFGCCHGRQPSRPVAFVHIGIFPFPCLVAAACRFPSLPPTKSGTCSHHPACSIIPPFDDEQAVSTATGPFPLNFFANYIVSWCIMQDMRSIQWFLAREHGSVLCT